MLNPFNNSLAGMLHGRSQTVLRRKSWPPGGKLPDTEHFNITSIEFLTTQIVLRPSVLAFGGVHLEITRSSSDPEQVSTFDWSPAEERPLAFGVVRSGRPDFHDNSNHHQI